MLDRTLVCKDCSASFVFSTRDQAFYAEKGFEHEPQRCRDCRTARKVRREAANAKRLIHEALCAACGEMAALPFKPRGDRPVYCRPCFLELAPAPALT